jgi:hypothetical protein
MRSLSYSPTEEEIHNYYQKYVKGNTEFCDWNVNRLGKVYVMQEWF